MEGNLHFWLKASNISEDNIGYVMAYVKNPTFLLEDLWVNKSTSAELKHLMLAVVQYCDLDNLKIHRNLYNSIYNIVYKTFLLTNGHKQNVEFNSLIADYTCKLSLENICHLWSMEMFKQISTKNSNYILCILGDYKHTEQFTYTVPVIEFIEAIASRIITLNKLMHILGYTEDLARYGLVIKKKLHIAFHQIVQTHSDYLHLKTTELKNIVAPNTFLKLKLNKVQGSTRKEYTKISLLVINMKFKENHHQLFNLTFSNNKILFKNNNFIITSIFLLNAQELIIQRYNKEETVLNPSIVAKVEFLANTKFYLDSVSLERTLTIVMSEYKNTLNTLQTLCEFNNSDYINVMPTYGEVKQFLAEAINAKKIHQYKQQFLQKKLVENIKSMEDEITTHEAISIKEFLKLNMSLEKLFKAWTTKEHEISITQDKLAEIQKLYSYLHILQSFLTFYVYVTLYNFEYCRFLVYLDFRGRIYYNSIASIQAHWCFRFLYHFGDYSCDLHSNEEIPEELVAIYTSEFQYLHGFRAELFEVFKSIGFLFKTQLTGQDGSIAIIDTIKAGLSTYFKYKDYDVHSLYLEFSTDCKLLVELSYYINIVHSALNNNPKNYYIWKDTTCSMSQHAGKLLGYRKESLHFLNLNNSVTAYDTYCIFINNLKAKLKLENSEIWTEAHLNLLNRKLLKNLIMTSEYGVTVYTAWTEFKLYLQTQEYTEQELNFINNYDRFLEIFNILKDGSLDKVLYLTSKQEWTDLFIKNGELAFTLPDLKMPINYFIKAPYPIYAEIKEIKNKRSRKVLTIYLSYTANAELYKTTILKKHKCILDKKKTKAALYVNAIHALDAYYLRQIVGKCMEETIPLATIHDGFAVPYVNGEAIIYIANKCFNNLDKIQYSGLFQNNLTFMSKTIII